MMPFFILEKSLGTYAPKAHTGSPDNYRDSPRYYKGNPIYGLPFLFYKKSQYGLLNS